MAEEDEDSIELRSQLKEGIKTKNAYHGLLKHPGWSMLCALVDDQAVLALHLAQPAMHHAPLERLVADADRQPLRDALELLEQDFGLHCLATLPVSIGRATILSANRTARRSLRYR